MTTHWHADRGKLKSLQWVNIGCGLCAGECVQTQEDGRLACASSLPSNCTCNLAANPGNCTNASDNLGLCDFPPLASIASFPRTLFLVWIVGRDAGP